MHYTHSLTEAFIPISHIPAVLPGPTTGEDNTWDNVVRVTIINTTGSDVLEYLYPMKPWQAEQNELKYPIESIWEITRNQPSLSRLLSEERENE